MIKPEINCHYQHRYGGIYIAKEIATSSVDKSKWVVYNHIYPFEYQTWIRPYDEWCDGRFRKISNSELNSLLGKDRAEFQIEISEARALAKVPKEGDNAVVNGKVCVFRNGKWATIQG